MEVFRIAVLSLLLWMAYVPYVATTSDPIYGEVGKELTLPCPSGATESKRLRAWYRGSYDANKTPGEDVLIYTAGPAEERKGDKMWRSDMKFDANTFAMTLTVHNSPIDNDHFTCVTVGVTSKYDVQEVLTFLQPVVDITTDIKPDEGVNVTVICTVERLYPNITNDQFTMMWGNSPAKEPQFSGCQHEDGFMKYTLEKSKNLTREDEGVEVTCKVTPLTNFGDAGEASMHLNFTMGPVTPKDPGPVTSGSSVGAIVGGVIGGLAAVVIVVIIMVVILKKRKPKKDSTKKQPIAKGTKTKTNKPVTEGLMYAELDLANQPARSTAQQEGSKPPVTPRPIQEPTEYAQIDFDKLKEKNPRDTEDLTLSDKEDL